VLAVALLELPVLRVGPFPADLFKRLQTVHRALLNSAVGLQTQEVGQAAQEDRTLHPLGLWQISRFCRRLCSRVDLCPL